MIQINILMCLLIISQLTEQLSDLKELFQILTTILFLSTYHRKQLYYNSNMQ